MYKPIQSLNVLSCNALEICSVWDVFHLLVRWCIPLLHVNWKWKPQSQKRLIRRRRILILMPFKKFKVMKLPLDTLQCCSLVNRFCSSAVGLRQCCARKPYFSHSLNLLPLYLYAWNSLDYRTLESCSPPSSLVFLRLLKNVCQWIFSVLLLNCCCE